MGELEPVWQKVWSPLRHSFTRLGPGYCFDGFFSGWVPEYAETLFKCAHHCDKQPLCAYFSFIQNETCSLYTYSPSGCRHRRGENTPHVSWGKDGASPATAMQSRVFD